MQKKFAVVKIKIFINQLPLHLLTVIEIGLNFCSSWIICLGF